MENSENYNNLINRDNSRKQVECFNLSKEFLKRRIDLAIGNEKIDLIITNANLVNVFSGEIYKSDVAIADGIFIGFSGISEYAKKGYHKVIDAQGRFMCPGLIDGHIHIESTFLSPREFCNLVASKGTSAVICDPHEIASVLGLSGIDFFLKSSHKMPVKVYIMMPSCVPTTTMETAGATILDSDIYKYLNNWPDSVIGLAELMNFPGVISKDDQILSKLIIAGSKPKDGHAPLLSGKLLDGYIIAGLHSDHECTNFEEAIEKLRKGMHIMIREGTHEKNLSALVPLINDFNSSHISLVSDDRDARDLKEHGHMDYLIRTAISLGVSPITAIQMTSINTAKYFGLNNIGAIAPGYRADFILLDDLESFKISEVFLNGNKIYTSNKNNIVNNILRKTDGQKDNYKLHQSVMPTFHNTINIKDFDSSVFVVSIKSILSSNIQVIGVIPGQIITQKRIVKPKIEKNHVVSDVERDLAKIAVMERHHSTGNIGLGFIQGLGLKTGAIASSVAHDSHNLIVAGMNDVDMLTAVKHISEIGGGLAVVNNNKVIASLSLPIAGLMSYKGVEEVISNLDSVNESCSILGDNIVKDPFMLLSFMSLPVIPELKLTDKGLIDVDKFGITNLWI